MSAEPPERSGRSRRGFRLFGRGTLPQSSGGSSRTPAGDRPLPQRLPRALPAVLRAARGSAPLVMTLHNYRLICLPATLLRDGRICEDCLGRVPWRGIAHACYRDSTVGSTVLATSLTLHRRLGTFDRVDLFLAVSQFVRAKHIAAGFDPNRIVVKPNFAWPGERRAGPGDYFLFTGRLSEEKGVRDTDRGLARAGRPAPGRRCRPGGGVATATRAAIRRVPRDRFRRRDLTAALPGPRAGDAVCLLRGGCAAEKHSRVVRRRSAGDRERDRGAAGVGSTTACRASWCRRGSPPLSPTPPGACSTTRDCERMGQGAWQLWRERFGPDRALSDLEAVYDRALGRSR